MIPISNAAGSYNCPKRRYPALRSVKHMGECHLDPANPPHVHRIFGQVRATMPGRSGIWRGGSKRWNPGVGCAKVATPHVMDTHEGRCGRSGRDARDGVSEVVHRLRGGRRRGCRRTATGVVLSHPNSRPLTGEGRADPTTSAPTSRWQFDLPYGNLNRLHRKLWLDWRLGNARQKTNDG